MSQPKSKANIPVMDLFDTIFAQPNPRNLSAKRLASYQRGVAQVENSSLTKDRGKK